tara:strand:- start:22772 stop:23146 length:375 start_codon:yes stop_codon:yes gene_type:complete
MSNTAELSVTIMCHMQKTLNGIVAEHGSISINNKLIWNKYLHQMDNVIWRGVLETLVDLHQQEPEYFDLHQIGAVTQGLETLNKYYDYYDNVLHINKPTMKHRGIAWRCLMVVREVMNTIEKRK